LRTQCNAGCGHSRLMPDTVYLLSACVTASDGLTQFYAFKSTRTESDNQKPLHGDAASLIAYNSSHSAQFL